MNNDTSTAPAATTDDRLTHLGLAYDTPAEFVTAVLPHLHGALNSGHAVTMLVDHQVGDRIRQAVGTSHGLERVTIESPKDTSQLSPQAFHGRLRDLSHAGRRNLVITQYSALGASERDCASMEDGVNLVLSDTGITLVCACARDLGPGMLAMARRSHPGWIASGTTTINREFQRPRSVCPVPSRVWGPPVLRMRFRDTGDLPHLRQEVARVAGEVGLRGDEAQAAVLAVHEAAVLTCRMPDRPPGAPAWAAGTPVGGQSSDPVADRLLEVRVSRTAMYTEILVPGGVAGVGGSPVPATGSRGDPVQHIRWFCHHATVHDSASGRAVRVLTDLRSPTTC